MSAKQQSIFQSQSYLIIRIIVLCTLHQRHLYNLTVPAELVATEIHQDRAV